MMRLSTFPNFIQGLNGRYSSVEACVERLSKAGFRYFAFANSYMIGNGILYEEDWERKVTVLAEKTDQLGCAFLQAHAPYTFSEIKPLDYYREMTRRLFEAAKILGVEQVVIHGYFQPDWTKPTTREQDLARAYTFYMPFVELADRLGFGIAVENLCNYEDPAMFTARVEDQLELIERLNAPHVSACWDSGHGYVAYGEDYPDQMKKLGKRITCTHIHDNSHQRDLHLPPFMGTIDWKVLMKTLREIGYRGDLNFELKKCLIPEHLLDLYLSFLYRSGQTLVSMFEDPC